MSQHVIPSEVPAAGPTVAEREEAARRAFSTSMVISGIRCVLSYVVLPILAPVIGFASGVGPVLGIIIATVAIVANVASIRRFRSSEHRWRVPMISINVSMIVLVSVLLVLDVRALLT